MSFNATTWVEHLGFMRSFSIYAGALAAATLGWPIMYFYGKKIRAFTGGKLNRTYLGVEDAGDEESKTPRSAQSPEREALVGR